MIRPARAEDAEAVAAIVAAAYTPYIARLGKPPGPMLDDYPRRIAQGQCWVAEQDGQLVGMLVLEESSDGLLLDNVAVAPAAQGRGIGHALIRFTEAEAARRGHRTIRLYTHVLMTENVALYTRAGFIETGRVSEKGYDRVYMAKTLR
ncbi:MAG: GNAT family N-acetyltransferase [Acidisphaera sp.]|nr:GNAT family N-acetyltransferase [Acidisphaera sp.]